MTLMKAIRATLLAEVAEQLHATYLTDTKELRIYRGEELLFINPEFEDEDNWSSFYVDDTEYDFNLYTHASRSGEERILDLYSVFETGEVDTSTFARIDLHIIE